MSKLHPNSSLDKTLVFMFDFDIWAETELGGWAGLRVDVPNAC